MERRERAPRPDWQARVEKLGLTFHTPGAPYWDESAFYAFTAAEVDGLDRATAELHARCLDAVQHVIDARRWDDLLIPTDAIALVERSWEEEPPSIYGRFIYQALAETQPRFQGKNPVLGSWVIQGEPAGLGIRESDGPITGNLSRFVPHLFEP